MARQHSAPLLLRTGYPGAFPLPQVSTQAGEGSVDEAFIQALVHEHPGSLPIAEIDPVFVGPVPICRELNTPAGAIDNFMITPSGLPVLVECKLWRNPEGRREVVGQILDYAKELSRWSSSDLQREVSRRLKRDGNPLLELVRAVAPDVDEVAFNDAVTTNLRRGRFLLLIVGDGIREGVEAIAEYLQAHAGLHFSLGLVELPIYELPGGGRLVVPRVLARTVNITRNVVAVPEGFALDQPNPAGDGTGSTSSPQADRQQQFWGEFLSVLKIDDPEQAKPSPARLGYLSFMLPAPGGSSWLTVYRDQRAGEVGVFLSSSRNSPGEYAMQAVADDWQTVRDELGGTAQLVQADGRPRIIDSLRTGALDQAEARHAAFEWLAERVNTFISVLRPRVRSAVADFQAREEGTK